MRSNLVLAGEDPVAADALAARLMGFNPEDIEFLHMASRRQMGTMDFGRIEVRGDEPDRFNRIWEKPKQWYGRCNRHWRVSARQDLWQQLTAPFDTLDLVDVTKTAPADSVVYQAEAVANSRGRSRGYLWLGLRGKLSARLNGETVAKLESQTRYRVGQFQFPVELRPGANRLEFNVSPSGGEALLSALVTGPRNSGDLMDGLQWQPA